MSQFVSIGLLCIFVAISPTAQTNRQNAVTSDGWFRVQSNDGEFSIEVPAKYKFYQNKIGFLESLGPGNIKISDMSMLNAYSSGTLLSFEVYKSDKDGLRAIYNHDSYRKEGIAETESKKQGYEVRQIASKTDQGYLIRQYFRSKGNIYVLTAASRSGENGTMRRFLDSLLFRPNTKENPLADVTRFSELAITDIGVDMQLGRGPASQAGTMDNANPPSSDILPVSIVHKPRTVYVDAARQKGVKGKVILRLTMDGDGWVSRIAVLESLPEGLLQQALFAAIRIKFLPQEQNGKPITVEKTVDYGFDIY